MRMSGSQVGSAADPDLVFAWRIERLRSAGLSSRLADTVAHDCRYDLHELLGLIDRGCPAELAARILAPLDEECDSC